MPELCVLSWNLRTLAYTDTPVWVVQQIATIIRDSRADVVAIQEVTVDGNVDAWIDAPIGQQALDCITSIRNALNVLDGGATWAWSVTGANCEEGNEEDDRITGSRDAYAYLWKGTPSQSHFPGPAPLQAIQLVLRPTIPVDGIQRRGDRQPGLATFVGFDGAVWNTFNVVNYHAPTPTNTFDPYKEDQRYRGAGCAINDLSWSPTIGGGAYLWTFRNPPPYRESVRSLPTTDTVLVGDFNYDMAKRGDLGKSGARTVYRGLSEGYTPCVSTFTNEVYTTYSPQDFDEGKLVSAFDNVFVLKARIGLVPALTPIDNASGAIDFIRTAANAVFPFVSFAKGWYQVHSPTVNPLYKKQWAEPGVSDHLPVWTRFAVGLTQNAGGARPQPTNNDDGNSLFHALYGQRNGEYIDVQAANRRETFATAVENLAGHGNPPERVRAALLSAVASEVVYLPNASQLITALTNQPMVSPFGSDNGYTTFASVFNSFVASIRNGRNLRLPDLGLLACLANASITVWIAHGTNYRSAVVNPQGLQARPPVFFQHNDFARWSA